MKHILVFTLLVLGLACSPTVENKPLPDGFNCAYTAFSGIITSSFHVSGLLSGKCEVVNNTRTSITRECGYTSSTTWIVRGEGAGGEQPEQGAATGWLDGDNGWQVALDGGSGPCTPN